MKKTPYEVLGVQPNATDDEIKAAYRRAASAAHPDRGGNHADMLTLNAARDALLKTERTEELQMGHARSVLSSMIEAALSSRADDIAAELRRMRHDAMENAAAQILEDEGKLKRAQSQLKKYRFKGAGEDLIKQVIEKRIARAEATIDAIRKGRELMDLVSVLLEDYLSPEKPAGQPAAPQFQFHDYGTFSSNGGWR